MKLMGWLVKRFVIGAFALYFFNFVGGYLDMSVPLNYVTAFLTGVLGVPGFILVYVLSKIVLI
ncbi:MAG: pro-sigmaK processing inhibitor BofA family protein [Turicibacter sp.]|nr:pro-sigmaK processing inhibitor BofA family protein [Turicibacter sp.]